MKQKYIYLHLFTLNIFRTLYNFTLSSLYISRTLYIFQECTELRVSPRWYTSLNLSGNNIAWKLINGELVWFVFIISVKSFACVWNVQCLVGVIGDKEWFRGSAGSILTLVCAQGGQVIRHGAVHKSLLSGFDIFLLALNFIVNPWLIFVRNFKSVTFA